MFDFFFQLPPVIQGLAKGLAVIMVIFPLAGACSLAERKVSAWMQGRPGPNRAIVPWIAWIPFLGVFLQKLGVFHLMSDGGKLLFKEEPVPGHVNKFYFILAPALAIMPAFTIVAVVPFGAYFDAAGAAIPLVLANVDIGLLAVFAVSSLGIYSLILAGWASNSKYPFLGSIRASAQLISYELAMTMSVIPVFLWINAPGQPGTMSLAKAVEFQSLPGFWGGSWFIVLMPISALIFLISLFAETNRHPFDMAESESDLVGGFHTEYGAFKFGIFFVAEYSHMVIGSALFILMFLGGWHVLPWMPTIGSGWVASLIGVAAFFLKLCFFLFFFVWVRWTIPRFRYDQVMRIGWRVLLPLAVLNLLAYFVWYAING